MWPDLAGVLAADTRVAAVARTLVVALLKQSVYSAFHMQPHTAHGASTASPYKGSMSHM